MYCFAFLAYIVLGWFFWLMPIRRIFRSNESSYRQPTNRILWFILVFALPPIGGILFLLVDPDAYGRETPGA